MKKLSKFYDKKKSEEMIRNRYIRSIPPIRSTLKRIVPTKEFQQLKEELRSDGWKDWHILLAFLNLVFNYKALKLAISISKMAEFSEIIMNQEEKEKKIQIPLGEFTKENMIRSLDQSMLSTLAIYGFSMKNKRLDINEVKKFLSEKFNYWNDDVVHEPIFDKF